MMTINESEYVPLLNKFQEKTRKGLIPEEVLEELQGHQNFVAKAVGMDLSANAGFLEGNAGLYEIFSFCERNCIESDEMWELFEIVYRLLEDNGIDFFKKYSPLFFKDFLPSAQSKNHDN